MRHHLELLHSITVLYNFATDEKDTISKLSDKQAKKAVEGIKALWAILERRAR